MSDWIVLDVYPGAYLPRIIATAVTTARVSGKRVTFTFNETPGWAAPHDDEETVALRYDLLRTQIQEGLRVPR